MNPATDFTQTPPGMLALDNMLYLAKLHQDTYIRVSSPLPLPRSSSLTLTDRPVTLLPLLPPPAHRSSWRTAAARTSTSVRLAAAPSS